MLGKNSRKSPKNRSRGLFTKLIKDKDATVRSKHDAVRFIEAMETFESSAELLQKLEDKRNMGQQRIQEVLSFMNSVQDVETILIPLLKHVMNKDTSRPLFRTLRNNVLMSIFTVPALLDTLVNQKVVDSLNPDSADCLCSFLLATSKAFVEARVSEPVIDMAIALRDRGDVREANTLCAVVLADQSTETQSPFKENVGSSPFPEVACWVTDTIPPGDRHDNDHLNYRNIQIVPTVQELLCTTQSYLPLANGENNTIGDPTTCLLDRNFRLLREDAVQTMKENIQERKRSWRNARVVGVDDSGKSGVVSFIVQCDSLFEGNYDWQRSRSLMHGSVIALCRGETPIRLGTITIRENDAAWLKAPGGPKIGMVFQSENDFDQSLEELLQNSGVNEEVCRLKAKMLGEKSNSREFLRELDLLMSRLVKYDLIEVSKSFFAYQPILSALQGMDGIPLNDEIVHLRQSETTQQLNYLPGTLKMPEGEIFSGKEVNLDMWSSNEVSRTTSLDISQARALHHMLTSRVSLIQGPPGTGKTFIGGLLAQIIRMNTDETIFCVCYTNHALDQFLEHMVQAGESRIVRLGGRSKSDKLAKFQIRELSHQKGRQAGDTNAISQRLRQVDAQLHRQRELIKKAFEVIQTPVEWKSPCGGIKGLLQTLYPDIYNCITVPVIAGGFEMVGNRGKKVDEEYLWRRWRKGETFPEWMIPNKMHQHSSLFQRFWNCSLDERSNIIETWRKEIIESETFNIHEEITTFNQLSEEKKMIRQEQDIEIIREARIIGATTSAAAKCRDIISASKANVVIVEEAGEVLESHILTALIEDAHDSQHETKHLILIGDHKQLRPKVENYNLTVASKHGYNLDCSLFERLVLSNLPSVMLQVQHRMRPSISKLIRAQTYSSLRDHESVHQYPNVKGVSKNVVFIDHRNPEDGEYDDPEDVASTSKSNTFEAELSIELVRYFLLQGYNSDQIVVLTPYLGQLLMIIQMMKARLKEVSSYISEMDRSDIEEMDPEVSEIENKESRNGNKVRCSSIDNFQGEEADIVIISLVRSNRRGVIGFLKEEQRVNVLLSRARHGLFLIGNSETLCQSSAGGNVWRPVLNILHEDGSFLEGLPTSCQLHPDDEPILLCDPVKFRTIRPNGGCDRPCTYRLPCGHVCPQTCHPIDRDHSAAAKKCCEPCRRFPPECTQGHPCLKLCKDPCGPCRTMVGPFCLPCGHTLSTVQCHYARSPEALEQLSTKCREEVIHDFKQCGHSKKTTCQNARSPSPKCPALCRQLSRCNHPCQNTCGDCTGKHDCKQRCSRKLFCGHLCEKPCHLPDVCGPCEKKCSVRCAHSICPQKCNEICSSCVEECDWSCDHRGQCKLVCGAPCSRLPCDKRCSKDLTCGHQCPSVCGEACPSKRFCQLCGNKKSEVVDMISFSTYEDHDVDTDPVVVLPCGHFFAISTLDGHLGLDEVYTRNDKDRSYVRTKSLDNNSVNEKPKVCPQCRQIIHSVRRYGRLLKLSELRSLERKHMTVVDDSLNIVGKLISNKNETKKQIQNLRLIKKNIKMSPMRKIYEASGGCMDTEVPAPPSRPLIRCLELMAHAYSALVEEEGEKCYKKSQECFYAAIEEATRSKSIRSAAKLHLSLAKLITTRAGDLGAKKTEVYPLLDWILGQEVLIVQDLFPEVRQLKRLLTDEFRKKELKEVMSAMSVISGYDYGGSAASHWFQCPNGHPYFIGECGGAMETSVCIECGEQVGGSNHQLLASNRQAEPS